MSAGNGFSTASVPSKVEFEVIQVNEFSFLLYIVIGLGNAYFVKHCLPVDEGGETNACEGQKSIHGDDVIVQVSEFYLN